MSGSGRMSRSSSSQSTHHPFGTSTSSSSLNIASALEAFDFLDSEVSSPQGEENGRGCGIQHQGNPTSASHDFSASSLRLVSGVLFVFYVKWSFSCSEIRFVASNWISN